MHVASDRLRRVRKRIDDACAKAGRNAGEVALLAVSKRHPASAVRDLFAAGQRRFGENLLQEALTKQRALDDLDVEWHFIGTIQSNKTRDIAAHFDWVQSVDRAKILQRLSDQRPVDRPDLNICLQVNIDREPQKGGVEPERLDNLVALAESLPGIRLRGLMCIPRLSGDADRTRRSMARLRELHADLRRRGHALDTLSMGMSADLEIAISEGSTMVRVGTDLFGARPDSP